MRGQRAFQAVNALMTALFVGAAALQLNDPDPLGWTALYLGAAGACLVARLSPRAWPVPVLVSVVALAWAATLAPEVARGFVFTDLFRAMTAQTPAIEVNRECLGLLIVAGWMLVLAVVARRGRG